MNIHGEKIKQAKNSLKLVLAVLLSSAGKLCEGCCLAVGKIRKSGRRWEDALLCATRSVDSGATTKMVLINYDKNILYARCRGGQFVHYE